MNKKEALSTITDEIAQCSICRAGGIGHPVPGEGNPNARVVFVGEAPGSQEAQTGRPFIGRSGQLLRKYIRATGLSEDDVFITSVCKYLPVTKTPTPPQIAHGKTHLWKQIKVILPRIIVLLGSVACKGVLEEPISVAKEHGKVIEKNGMKCFISYHPAAAIRFKKNLILFEQDFNMLKGLITSL